MIFRAYSQWVLVRLVPVRLLHLHPHPKPGDLFMKVYQCIHNG